MVGASNANRIVSGGDIALGLLCHTVVCVNGAVDDCGRNAGDCGAGPDAEIAVDDGAPANTN